MTIVLFLFYHLFRIMVIDPNLSDKERCSIRTRLSRQQKQPAARGQRWYQWLKWGDWLLYAVIGIMAVTLFFALPGIGDDDAVRAVFTQGGAVILTLSAEQLQAGGSFELDAGGYHYQIVYEAGRIRFAEADCPDKVCVRTGWISRSGQIAACVPGHLIIKIEGGSGNQTTGPDDVDVIVG